MQIGMTNPGLSQLLDSYGAGNNPFSNLFPNSKPGRGINPHEVSGLDQVELSPETQVHYQRARAQFEINYQSIRSISGPDGNFYEEVNFSFKGSYEFLRATTGQQPFDIGEANETNLMKKMQDLFSPEKTAERILNFALSQYSKTGSEDTEALRQEFSDYIGAAIQKGFDSALGMLGNIAENIRAGIDKTHELIFKGLEDFVSGGLSEGQAENSDAINTYTQLWQASIQIEYSSLRISSYNNRGEVQTAPETTAASEPFEAMA